MERDKLRERWEAENFSSTGLLYKAMGFPTQMFTPLFALGRLPGWIAQWREMINDPATKIGRPRQVYTGPALRSLDR